MLNEAVRMLKYLQKYYKYRLKLNLSSEKTLITDLTEKRAKFLGYELEAKPPRASPKNKGFKGLVGKFYPDKEKAIVKTRSICKEIWKLRVLNSNQDMAAQIEKINAIIMGTSEYYKVAICSNIYSYMDYRIKQTAYRTFRKIYGKRYKEYRVPLSILSNRPQRHEKRLDKTYTVKHQDMYIGITKAYITHSQWDKCNYNQRTTPYSEEGRNLHVRRLKSKKIKSLPLNRQPIYDEITLFKCNDNKLNNFEYYMNREYAYNRDKGRCRICGNYLKANFRHCHRINPVLPIELINKVPNLAWLCLRCVNIIRSDVLPIDLNAKMKSKVLKFQEKLKKFKLSSILS
jgi:RNA-directed DNA polymerase